MDYMDSMDYMDRIDLIDRINGMIEDSDCETRAGDAPAPHRRLTAEGRLCHT